MSVPSSFIDKGNFKTSYCQVGWGAVRNCLGVSRPAKDAEPCEGPSALGLRDFPRQGYNSRRRRGGAPKNAGRRLPEGAKQKDCLVLVSTLGRRGRKQ